MEKNCEGINFTALDFETANSSRASICQVGLVRVENGKIASEMRQLIKPEGRFDARFVQIHGIDERAVKNAPRFCDFWEEMRPMLGPAVVAHNAAFDISCLRAETEHYGLAPEDFEYYCTLKLSRKFLPSLASHRLEEVAKYMGIADFKHHDALDDARACAMIFMKLAEKFDISQTSKNFLRCISPGGRKVPPSQSRQRDVQVSFQSLKRIPPETDFPLMPFPKNTFPKKLPKRSNSRKRTQIENCLDFDFSDIDFTKTFSVTGIFRSISRREVENLIMYMGGRVSPKVDSQTDYLIVGSVIPPSWEMGEYGTQIDAALELGTVSLIAESHFLSFF